MEIPGLNIPSTLSKKNCKKTLLPRTFLIIFISHHNDLISSTFYNCCEKISPYLLQSCHPPPCIDGAIPHVYGPCRENEMDQ
jgi:hypothetical protein